MGRSVSYPSDTLIVAFRDYETGYQVTAEHVADGDHDEDQIGDWIENEFAFDDMREDFESTASDLWPSLSLCDEWIGREDHVMLANGLVKMGMSEYCGLIAYWVVPACDDAQLGLAEAWARRIEARFQSTFGTLRKMGSMSNGEGVYQRVA